MRKHHTLWLQWFHQSWPIVLDHVTMWHDSHLRHKHAWLYDSLLRDAGSTRLVMLLWTAGAVTSNFCCLRAEGLMARSFEWLRQPLNPRGGITESMFIRQWKRQNRVVVPLNIEPLSCDSPIAWHCWGTRVSKRMSCFNSAKPIPFLIKLIMFEYVVGVINVNWKHSPFI